MIDTNAKKTTPRKQPKKAKKDEKEKKKPLSELSDVDTYDLPHQDFIYCLNMQTNMNPETLVRIRNTVRGELINK